MDATVTREMLDKPFEGFKSAPQYFSDGDFITYFLKSELFYAMRVDPLLTVYRSEANDEIIGYKIKSVVSLLEEMRRFGIDMIEHSYDDGDLKLSLLFLAAAAVAPDQSSRDKYRELAGMSKDISIPKEQLPTLAA